MFEKKQAISIFALSVILFQSGNADNRSDQMNPNNDSYWESRGYDERPDDWETRDDNSIYDDNRSNQLNPNNDAYWQSRGYDEKPDDWDSDDVGEDDEVYIKDNTSRASSEKSHSDPGNDKKSSIALWFFKANFPWLKWPGVLVLVLLVVGINVSQQNNEDDESKK